MLPTSRNPVEGTDPAVTLGNGIHIVNLVNKKVVKIPSAFTVVCNLVSLWNENRKKYQKLSCIVLLLH